MVLKKVRTVFFLGGVVCLALVAFFAGFTWKKSAKAKINKTHFAHVKGSCPEFVGRQRYLEQLAKELLPKQNVQEYPRSIKLKLLWGKGGFGKSELAIEFANRYLAQFSFVWTFWCDSAEHFERGYRLLAEKFGIVHETESLEKVKHKVHTYLENHRFERPWLLIYDNVERELDYPQRGGVVLATSQKRVLSPEFTLEVEPFTKEESIELLEKITLEKYGPGMQKLIQALEGIPLLTNYAAHYIRATPGCSVDDYEQLFSAHFLEKEGPFWKNDEINRRYLKSLAASWRFPLHSLKEENPLALEWLYVCSYLYPEHIREEWIDAWLMQKVGIPASTLEIKRREVLAALQNYGVIRYDQKTKTFSLHRFFQHMIRESRSGHFEEDLGQAIAVLDRYAKDYRYEDFSSWERGADWYAHACEVKKWLTSFPKDAFGVETRLQIANLYAGIGNWCGDQCRFSEGVEVNYQALDLRKSVEGEESQDVAAIYQSIGWGFHNFSRYHEALAFCDKALVIQQRHREERPLDYALTLNVKGLALYHQGKYPEAFACHQEALELRIKHLGEVSFEVATSLNNIGICLREWGENERALEFLDKALTLERKTCGEKHPFFAHTLANKASVLFNLGQYRPALKLYRKALSVIKKDRHHNFMWVGIGWCHFKKGEYKDARKAFKKGLAVGIESYGRDTRPTIRAYNGMAWNYLRQKCVKKALKYLALQLEISAKVYHDTPKLVTILENFQEALKEAKALGGKVEQPAALAKNVSEELLGAGHKLTYYFQKESIPYGAQEEICADDFAY